MKCLLCLTFLLLAGCQTGPPPPNEIQIKIESDPSGARVYFGTGSNEGTAEKGREYVGTTPCVWACPIETDGTFKITRAGFYNTVIRPVAVFTAEPPSTATNLFIKKQIFHGVAHFQDPDKVPRALFFDLTKP